MKNNQVNEQGALKLKKKTIMRLSTGETLGNSGVAKKEVTHTSTVDDTMAVLAVITQ